MAKAIFLFNGIQTTIECMKEDKMKAICDKFIIKVGIDINTILLMNKQI